MKDLYEKNKIKVIPYYDDNCITRISINHLKRILSNLKEKYPDCDIIISTYYDRDYKVISNHISSHGPYDVGVDLVYDKQRNIIESSNNDYIICCKSTKQLCGISGVESIPIDDYIESEDSEYDNRVMFTILPYYGVDVNRLMNKEDIELIIKGIKKEYRDSIVVINIVPLSNEHCKLLKNMRVDDRIDTYISPSNNLMDITSFLLNGSILVIDGNFSKYNFDDMIKFKIIDAGKYLHKEELHNDILNRYCIAPVDIKDGKFRRLKFNELTDIIYDLHDTEETILIWYSLEFFNTFKDSNKHLIKLAEFIEEEFGSKDVHVIVSDKSLDEISADWYKIVCTENIRNYYHLNFLELDSMVIIPSSDKNDEKQLLIDNIPKVKPLMVLPYDEHNRVMPHYEISEIITNIRNKVSKNASIVIKTLNQNDFEYLSNILNIRMMDKVSVVLAESNFMYEKAKSEGFDIIANKAFIPKGETYMDINNYYESKPID